MIINKVRQIQRVNSQQVTQLLLSATVNIGVGFGAVAGLQNADALSVVIKQFTLNLLQYLEPTIMHYSRISPLRLEQVLIQKIGISFVPSGL